MHAYIHLIALKVNYGFIYLIFYFILLLHYTILFIQDLQDESQRFDGEKYLASIQSATKRNIVAADETENVEE